MSPASAAARPSHLRPAQARIVDAALALFAEHGISGTSLQMIADALDVTKAAVYHQFRTKEEIVAAVVSGPLRALEEALDIAEGASSRAVAVEVIVDRFVTLVVEQRQVFSRLQGDPVLARFIAEHEALRTLGERLNRLLLGDDTGPASRVRVAMFGGAVPGAVGHALVADLDDDQLRRHLVDLGRRFLELPVSPPVG